MSRLEIVHVRLSDESAESISTRIRRSLPRDTPEVGLVTLYRRCGLETDVAVHIYRESSRGDVTFSALGIRLASALGDLGLIEHSQWESIPPAPRESNDRDEQDD